VPLWIVLVCFLARFTQDYLVKTKYNSGKLLFLKVVATHSFETALLLYVGHIPLWSFNKSFLMYFVSQWSLSQSYHWFRFFLHCMTSNSLLHLDFVFLTTFTCVLVCGPTVFSQLVTWYKASKASGGVVDKKTLSTYWMIWVFWNLYFAHPLVLVTSLREMVCQAFPGGNSYLLADTSIDCGTSEYGLLMRLGTVVFCLYAIAIPAAVVYKMWFYRVVIPQHDLSWWGHSRFGLLYQGYKIKFWWWEVLVQTRKGMLICTIIGTKSQGTVVQLLTALLIYTAALVAQILVEPSESQTCKACSTASMASNIMILIASLYTQSIGLTADFAMFLNFVIAVGLVGPVLFMMFRAYGLYVLFEEDPEVVDAEDPYQDPSSRKGRRVRQRNAENAELGEADISRDVSEVVEERHVASWLRQAEVLNLDATGDKIDLPVVIEMASIPTMGHAFTGEDPAGLPEESAATVSPKAPKKKMTKKKKKKVLPQDPELAAKTEGNVVNI